MKILGFLFGYKRISVPRDKGAELLNVCMKYSYPYFKMGEENGELYVFCTAYTAFRLVVKCRELSVPCSCGKICGAPAIAASFFRRGGLVLGLLAAIFIVCGSQNYLWDIRVSTYGDINADDIVAELAECGFYRGCSLNVFSADAVENLFLQRSEKVGWISVNMKGTVAFVEAIEKRTKPPSETKRAANVVASHDGIIVEALTYNGFRTVEVGEAVREGQLLISGAYGEKTPGLHITRAAGRIMAKTFRTLSVEISLEYTEKVETGRTFCEKYINFFGKEIKVFSNSGNLGVSCDKIVDREICSFFGAEIPIEIRTENYIEYKTVQKTRNAAEAEALARAELERQLSELGVERIVGREERVELSGGKCVVELDLVCIENIAKTVEFTVNYKD